MMVYVISYDVSDDKVRQRIARILKGYGDRVQYSVFEVALRSPAQLQDLTQALQAAADADTDIRFYRLCADCRAASHDLQHQAVAQWPATVVL